MGMWSPYDDYGEYVDIPPEEFYLLVFRINKDKVGNKIVFGKPPDTLKTFFCKNGENEFLAGEDVYREVSQGSQRIFVCECPICGGEAIEKIKYRSSF